MILLTISGVQDVKDQDFRYELHIFQIAAAHHRVETRNAQRNLEVLLAMCASEVMRGMRSEMMHPSDIEFHVLLLANLPKLYN